MAPQQPQQPQQPIKQFQPGVAPVVPDGQGKIYAKGTGGPVVNDQSVPAMTPVKPSATTPQPLNVPQVGVFPPDPSKMANFNNKYLRIAKEWRKKTAEKAGIMEKKAIGLGLLSSGLGALTTGNKDLYGNLKDKFEWATDKVDGWRGGFGSSHAGATSQGQGGGYGGQPNPFDAPGDLGWEHKYGPPLKPGGLQSTAREFGQGPVTLKPQQQPTAAPHGSATPSSTTRAAPAAPAPFKTQWYVPGGRGASSGFGGSVPYTGNTTDVYGEPYNSGRIKVTSQAQKDKIDAHYNRRQAEYHRRKALWQKNMQGGYHRRNIPYWKYSADKFMKTAGNPLKSLEVAPKDLLKALGVLGVLGGTSGAAVGGISNWLRGKSVGRGLLTGGLTGAGIGMGTGAGSYGGIVGTEAALESGLVGDSWNLPLFAAILGGHTLTTGGGAGAGGYAGYQLAQKLMGRDEEDEKQGMASVKLALDMFRGRRS